MKYSATLFCLIVLCNVCPAQKATLSGMMLHPLSDTVTLSYPDNPFTSGQTTLNCLLKNDGRFSFSVPVRNRFQQMAFTNGNQVTELFLAPGDALDMHLDGEHFDSSIMFTGAGAERNNFVAAHTRDRDMSTRLGAELSQKSGAAPDSFTAIIESEKQREADYLDAYQGRLGADFHDWWKAMLDYTYAGIYLIYPVYHQAISQHSYSIKSIPAANYEVLKKAAYPFNDGYLGMAAYERYVEQYPAEEFRAAHAGDTGVYTKEDAARDALTAAAYRKMPPQTAALFNAYQIHDLSLSHQREAFKNALAAFRKKNPASPWLAALDEDKTAINKTEAGEPAMDFSFTTIDGKSMMLSDLKGKVVLLDFWASWCGPCRQEMKFAPKLHEHFKGKDVVFLYASVDTDGDKWKAAINADKIEGTHTLIDGDFDGPVGRRYHLQGVPGYYLIDKKGNFALATVPRPSDTAALIAAIEALL